MEEVRAVRVAWNELVASMRPLPLLTSSIMSQVNKLHHEVQSMRVQSTVKDATSTLEKSNPSSGTGAAMSSNMRSALEKEFDEKKVRFSGCVFSIFVRLASELCL